MDGSTLSAPTARSARIVWGPSLAIPAAILPTRMLRWRTLFLPRKLSAFFRFRRFSLPMRRYVDLSTLAKVSVFAAAGGDSGASTLPQEALAWLSEGQV